MDKSARCFAFPRTRIAVLFMIYPVSAFNSSLHSFFLFFLSEYNHSTSSVAEPSREMDGVFPALYYRERRGNTRTSPLCIFQKAVHCATMSLTCEKKTDCSTITLVCKRKVACSTIAFRESGVRKSKKAEKNAVSEKESKKQRELRHQKKNQKNRVRKAASGKQHQESRHEKNDFKGRKKY